MSSVLFKNQTPNSMNLMQLVNELQQGNPEAIYNEMYNSNPQFKQFVDENKGLSMQDIARKYGIPL